MDDRSILGEFLEMFLFRHNDDQFMEDDLQLLNMFNQAEGPPMLKIQALKDKGNEFFKNGLFSKAGFCYDKACKLLCRVIGATDDFDVKYTSDLAISLNLNIAACANKIHEYEAAVDYSSFILTSFPKNAKALYRRAIALMKLNKLVDARLDLEMAASVEPKNKDILRELDVVKNLLVVNSHGKRISDHKDIGDSPRNGKRLAVMVESIVRYPPEEMDISPCISTLGSSHEIKTEDSCIIDVCSTHSSASSSPDMEAESKSDNAQNYLDQKTVHFTKKGGSQPQLQISGSCYRKLCGGKVLSFYQKSKMTIMTVRILQPICSEPESHLVQSNANKKRRKRRRRKTRKKNVRQAKVDDVAFDHVEDSTVPSPNRGQSSGLLNQSLSIKSFTTMSEPDNSHSTQPFVFSSSAPRYKKLQPTTKKMKLNNNQGDESPRCSFSAFSKSRASSRKFLRPRGVSVSCCRYPRMVQQRKKRKSMSSQKTYSERPLKKHFRGVSPISSFRH